MSEGQEETIGFVIQWKYSKAVDDHGPNGLTKSYFINIIARKFRPEVLTENTALSTFRAAGLYPLNQQESLDRCRKSTLGTLVEAPEQPDSFRSPSRMNLDPYNSDYATLSSECENYISDSIMPHYIAKSEGGV
ncbi:hypothetical protein K3495_g14296 [Podosphaera aphanis]|nr:hypothetical protein K3495_g14296 [Podosphaera aphanis]